MKPVDPFARQAERPKGMVVNVKGTQYQLVNWFDCQGWEVRAFDPNVNDAQPAIGRISQYENAAGKVTWTATLPNRDKTRGFKNKADAIGFLARSAR